MEAMSRHALAVDWGVKHQFKQAKIKIILVLDDMKHCQKTASVVFNKERGVAKKMHPIFEINQKS